jgi:hypothetical protein
MRILIAAAALLALCLVVAPSPALSVDEPFSFYGLQFGMTKQEVGRRFPVDGNLVKNPGHGMSDLEVYFDREDLLMEIRASYPKPEEPFESAGLQRALRERFVGPVSAKYPAIAVTIDEFSNRAAVKVVFLATNLREKSIEFHKNRFLKLFQ